MGIVISQGGEVGSIAWHRLCKVSLPGDAGLGGEKHVQSAQRGSLLLSSLHQIWVTASLGGAMARTVAFHF